MRAVLPAFRYAWRREMTASTSWLRGTRALYSPRAAVEEEGGRHNRDAARMKPAALAFLGDAVWELAARENSIFPVSENWSAREAADRATRLKCAEAQSKIVQQMLEGYDLNQREREWIRRGKNSVKTVPPRIPAKIYREATSMEVLLGYLYVTDKNRLDSVLKFAFDRSKSLPSSKELLKGRQEKLKKRREKRDASIDSRLWHSMKR